MKAFGVRAGGLLPLAGGLEQTAWRAGDIVLKPVQAANHDEGDWIAAVLDVIVEDGFRVIKPVRAADGRWLADGWAAWRWFDGEHERTRWQDVRVAAEAFHRALRVAVDAAGVDARPAWLDTRGHRWALAEGVVWRGEPLPTAAIYDVPEWELFERFRVAGPPLTVEEAERSQVVHGDIAGNVLVGTDGTPTFIDMSPGWRTPSSAEVQILVEGYAFFGGVESVLAGFDRADIARACAFRLMCGFQALAIGLELNPEQLTRFRRILDLVDA